MNPDTVLYLSRKDVEAVGLSMSEIVNALDGIAQSAVAKVGPMNDAEGMTIIKSVPKGVGSTSFDPRAKGVGQVAIIREGHGKDPGVGLLPSG